MSSNKWLSLNRNDNFKPYDPALIISIRLKYLKPHDSVQIICIRLEFLKPHNSVQIICIR